MYMRKVIALLRGGEGKKKRRRRRGGEGRGKKMYSHKMDKSFGKLRRGALFAPLFARI